MKRFLFPINTILPKVRETDFEQCFRNCISYVEILCSCILQFNFEYFVFSKHHTYIEIADCMIVYCDVMVTIYLIRNFKMKLYTSLFVDHLRYSINRK